MSTVRHRHARQPARPHPDRAVADALRAPGADGRDRHRRHRGRPHPGRRPPGRAGGRRGLRQRAARGAARRRDRRRRALLQGPADRAGDPGLVLAAVPGREDPRDALVARDRMVLGELPPGPVSAPVRRGGPRSSRALGLGLEIVPIRGNVDTRIRKVADGEVDAVVLARAGLARLGRLDEITEVLDPLQMLPAPAQGALACECRVGRCLVEQLLRAPCTTTASPRRWTAERAVLAGLGSPCSAPVGALADIVVRSRRRRARRRAVVTACGGRHRGRRAGACVRHRRDQGRRADRAGPRRRADRRTGRRRTGSPRSPPRAIRMGTEEMTAPSTTAGRVAFVGSGPGDPGLLTVRARDALPPPRSSCPIVGCPRTSSGCWRRRSPCAPSATPPTIRWARGSLVHHRRRGRAELRRGRPRQRRRRPAASDPATVAETWSPRPAPARRWCVWARRPADPPRRSSPRSAPSPRRACPSTSSPGCPPTPPSRPRRGRPGGRAHRGRPHRRRRPSTTPRWPSAPGPAGAAGGGGQLAGAPPR